MMPVPEGAPHHPPEDISAPDVLGVDVIADAESRHARVFGDDAQGDVGFGVDAVFRAGQFARLLDDGPELVRLEDVLDALEDGGDAFEAHACIDVGLWEIRERAVGFAPELGEDQVPQFAEPVAAAFGAAFIKSPPAANTRPEVDVDLAARAAGHVGDFPEVLGLAQAADAVRGDADLLLPDAPCFVVVLVNGRPELIRGHAEDLGDVFPAPDDGFFLEIVAKRKVAEHLEERAMAGREADLLDIDGAHALLAGGCAGEAVRCGAQEVGFELHHPGAGEEDGRVAFGDEAVAGDAFVAFFLKELEVAFAELGRRHTVHDSGVPSVQMFPRKRAEEHSWHRHSACALPPRQEGGKKGEFSITGREREGWGSMLQRPRRGLNMNSRGWNLRMEDAHLFAEVILMRIESVSGESL